MNKRKSCGLYFSTISELISEIYHRLQMDGTILSSFRLDIMEYEDWKVVTQPTPFSEQHHKSALFQDTGLALPIKQVIPRSMGWEELGDSSCRLKLT